MACHLVKRNQDNAKRKPLGKKFFLYFPYIHEWLPKLCEKAKYKQKLTHDEENQYHLNYICHKNQELTPISETCGWLFSTLSSNKHEILTQPNAFQNIYPEYVYYTRILVIKVYEVPQALLSCAVLPHSQSLQVQRKIIIIFLDIKSWKF